MASSTTLDVKDIQGIFKGFGLKWPSGKFFYCHYADAAAGQKLLKTLGKVTSCFDLKSNPDICINLAFSHAGIRQFDLSERLMASLPPEFCEGMRARAAINGDAGESDPALWEAVWHNRAVHIWIGVYAKTDDTLAAWEEKFITWVEKSESISILDSQSVSRFVASPNLPVYIDDPDSQPQAPVLLEHFGFRDGMSNPAIKGLADKHVAGGGGLDVEGNWHSLATGEFLLGHIDCNGEMPQAPLPPSFSRNGSFMVLRKLEQDVDLFRAYLQGQANKLKQSADDIAARMVGRHRSGEPLMPSNGDYDFRFGSDPEGRVCPMGAHIRRTNPRDSFGSQFGSLLVDRHRILRRAITYGEPVPRGVSQAEVNGDTGQGLMFIVLNASISRQFEFVQQQWVNYGNDFNQGNDRDPIIGLQTGGGQMIIPGNEDRPTLICDDIKQFVRCRGGDYFFLPSLRVINALAHNEHDWGRSA